MLYCCGDTNAVLLQMGLLGPSNAPSVLHKAPATNASARESNVEGLLLFMVLPYLKTILSMLAYVREGENLLFFSTSTLIGTVKAIHPLPLKLEGICPAMVQMHCAFQPLGALSQFRQGKAYTQHGLVYFFNDGMHCHS